MSFDWDHQIPPRGQQVLTIRIHIDDSLLDSGDPRRVALLVASKAYQDAFDAVKERAHGT
jgi:hypothetical protein